MHTHIQRCRAKHICWVCVCERARVCMCTQRIQMHVLRETRSSFMCEWDIKLLWFQMDWNATVCIHCMHIVYGVLCVCVIQSSCLCELSIFHFKYTNTTVAHNRLIQEENQWIAQFIDLVFSIFRFLNEIWRIETYCIDWIHSTDWVARNF